MSQSVGITYTISAALHQNLHTSYAQTINLLSNMCVGFAVFLCENRLTRANLIYLYVSLYLLQVFPRDICDGNGHDSLDGDDHTEVFLDAL